MIKNEKKAVALEYGTNAAPKVTAKGSEEVALAIIEEARQKGAVRDQAAAFALSLALRRLLSLAA